METTLRNEGGRKEAILVAGHTVPPRLLLDGLPVAGVVSPLSGCFPEGRGHPGDEDEGLCPELIGSSAVKPP